MSLLFYTKFNYEGEMVGFVDYIDRMMGTPHPPRTIKEESDFVKNAIEQPVISIYQNTHGTGPYHFADCIKSEIESVVDIVRRYTWLSEDAILELAYDILRAQ